MLPPMPPVMQRITILRMIPRLCAPELGKASFLRCSNSSKLLNRSSMPNAMNRPFAIAKFLLCLLSHSFV